MKFAGNKKEVIIMLEGDTFGYKNYVEYVERELGGN